MSDHNKTRAYGSQLVGSKHCSVTPAPSADELRNTPFPTDLGRSRPPPARRTSDLDEAPRLPAAPAGAPGWMNRAQHMVNALLAAIESGVASDTTEAAIERAWTAWELNGASDRQVAKVAHLAHRAYTAMHESARAGLERTITDCALVLHTGMPPALRRRVSFEAVTETVRQLGREPEPWPAVVRATSHLLGWDDAAHTHAAHAVRIALEHRAER